MCLLLNPGLRRRCYDGREAPCRVGEEAVPCVFGNRKVPLVGNLPDLCLVGACAVCPDCSPDRQCSGTILPFHFSPFGEGGRRVKGKINKINLLNTFWGSGKYTGPLWNPRTLYKKNQEDEVCWWASATVCLCLCVQIDCLSGAGSYTSSTEAQSPQKDSLLCLGMEHEAGSSTLGSQSGNESHREVAGHRGIWTGFSHQPQLHSDPPTS